MLGVKLELEIAFRKAVTHPSTNKVQPCLTLAFKVTQVAGSIFLSDLNEMREPPVQLEGAVSNPKSSVEQFP